MECRNLKFDLSNAGISSSSLVEQTSSVIVVGQLDSSRAREDDLTSCSNHGHEDGVHSCAFSQ
eukprot:SAG31_NODE_1070_length_10071_cov_6.989771_11_plen_63_part_00